jgi:ubiquinone/menaquinone biosynthesis C-methylase UbiE
VGLYDRYVLPRLLDLACGVAPVRAQRQKVVPHAHGRVLEVGVGSGLNLPHYDKRRVEALIGLDPSPELRRIAERRARQAGLDVAWLGLEAEQIPLETASVDSIVITYTLCTIADPLAALAEMRRVLKPGGSLYFSEHGRAPDARVAALQDRLTPYWRRLAGGCELNRDVPALLRAAGFDLVEFEATYVPRLPRFVGYTAWGSARAAA